MSKQQNGRTVSGEKPRINYPDGSGLQRPFDLPRNQLSLLLVFVIAAAIIGGIFLFQTYDSVVNGKAHEAAALEENINKPISLDLPVLANLMILDDATIETGFTDAGLITYRFGAANEYVGGLDLIKLPADISLADAGVAYTTGIDKLSASNAAKYLNGSWRLMVDRGEYIDMRVKYADFVSADPATALQTTLVSEGIDPATAGEIATDEAGNTFYAGTFDTGDTPYKWKASACSLSDIYRIDGLPSTALYIVFRMYQ
ncbi:MAG: teichoic acid transporter [Raoultibacter sp.]